MGFARRGSNPLGVAFFVRASSSASSYYATIIRLVQRFKLCCHYSLVVERQPCKLKVLGSIPSGGLSSFIFLNAITRSYMLDAAVRYHT
jgi:hypothetical protein